MWAAQHAHPVVRGIGDGSLASEAFARYLRQDYLFLIDYGRLLALGAARAPSLPLLRRFAELAHAVLGVEMDLHRAFSAEWGIAAERLEAEPADPLTRGYVDFLLRTAALGDFAELAAALLPCMWGYAELGAALAPGAERYRAWIAQYAGEDFQRLAAWCRELVDDLAASAGADARERMRAAFLTSSRHELAFWDVARAPAGGP